MVDLQQVGIAMTDNSETGVVAIRPTYDETCVVAIRATYERHGWIAPELMTWALQLTAERRHRVGIFCVLGAPNAAASANKAAEIFLRGPGEWLCLVDNDAVPPMDMMRILDGVAPETDILSGVTTMVGNGYVHPQQGMGGLRDGEQFIPVVVDGNRHEVDRVGGGCWFIRRRVFDNMAQPYFKEVFDEQTQWLRVSDDIYFQEKAHEAGARMICDTRFIVSHFHQVDLARMPVVKHGQD